MAQTPEEIQAQAEAQANLNRLIKEYNSLTGQRISNPIDPKDFKDATSYAKALNNEIVKFTKINADSQKELGSAIDSLTDSLNEYEKATGRAIKNRINPKNYKTAAEYAKALKDEQSRINSLLLNAESGLESISSRFSDIGKEIKAGFGKSTNSAMKSVKKIYSLTEDLFEVQQDLTQASAKDVKQQKEKVIAEFDRLNRQLKGLEVQERENDLAKKRVESELSAGKISEAQATSRLTKLTSEGNKIAELKNLAEERSAEFENQNGLIKDISDAYDETLDRINNINNATGLTGKLLEGVGGTLEKLGFKGVGEKVTEINKKLKEQAVTMTDNGKNVTSFGQKFSLLKTGVTSLGSALIKSLSDPLVVLGLLTAAMKKLVDMGMHISQEITDLGRSFNISRDAAEEMFNSIKKAAVASGTLTGTTEDMIKAQMSINQIMGTRTMLSGEELETQVALTKLAGLSNEQAAELYKYSLLTGKSSEDLYDAIAAQGEGLFNNRQILQEALEVEGQLAAQYKNDPKLIAAAVRQVKKLGITLQQAQSISKSMLDFESSIESELEAQLLTGKQMNLSRVRELALQGKTAEAASLALKQAGSLSEFQNMNVIAQESLANAMGMSTDELSKSLAEQERINILMAQNPGLDRQQATLQAQRENMSASEKLNASMSKLGDAFAKIVGGPVTFAVDAFSKIVGGLASMPGLAKIIAGGGIVLGGLALLTKGLPAVFTYFKRAATRPAGSASEPTTTDLTQQTIDSLSSASNTGGTGGIGDSGADGGYMDAQGRYRDKKTGRYKKQPKGTKGSQMKGPKGSQMKGPKGSKMKPPKLPKGGGMMARMGGMGGTLMSGLSMAAQAAPVAASMFGRNLEQQGADAGNRTKETVGSSMAQAGDVGLAKQAGGFLGGIGGKIGGLLGNLNPIEAVKKTVGKYAPKVLKAAPKMAKRIPILGAAIEGIFARGDIKEMIASGLPADDVYQDVGRRGLQAMGGIIGGAGASMAIQAANIVPGLGVVLTPLAGLAGDFIGRSLGGLLADASPGIAGSVGKGLSSLFSDGDKIESRDKVQNTAKKVADAKQIKTPEPEVKLATGGIVSEPTTALIGEAGPEAVLPLDALYRKFDQLIDAVNKGGSVYIDGNKAGEALVMGTYKSS